MRSWEWEIVEAAIDALARETDLRASIDDAHEDSHDLTVEIGKYQFLGEAKRWAAHRIPDIVQFPADGPNRLLIADYVNANAAKRLRDKGIQFIDTAGNAYIDRPGLKILIRGNSRPDKLVFNEAGQPGVRAFQRKGLILIYHLLTRPELVNTSLRTIASESGVSHGTADNVIKALETGGFVAKGRNGRRRLLEKHKLMERWVAGYGETLAPKLTIGTFYSEDTRWWGTDIQEFSAAWGGEIAAAQYTGYLSPQIATLFLPRANFPTLMQRYRLRKAATSADANLRIMERFWDEDEHENGFVHPLLAYAELLYSADTRNAETARILYDRYLADDFGTD